MVFILALGAGISCCGNSLSLLFTGGSGVGALGAAGTCRGGGNGGVSNGGFGGGSGGPPLARRGGGGGGRISTGGGGGGAGQELTDVTVVVVDVGIEDFRTPKMFWSPVPRQWQHKLV